MQRMMQGCTYPSVLIDDLYKTNPHFSLVIMVACDPYVHSWHTPEIIISNTWSATHRMYITQGRDHWDPHTWCRCDKWGCSHTSWHVVWCSWASRGVMWGVCAKMVWSVRIKTLSQLILAMRGVSQLPTQITHCHLPPNSHPHQELKRLPVELNKLAHQVSQKISDVMRDAENKLLEMLHFNISHVTSDGQHSRNINEIVKQ